MISVNPSVNIKKTNIILCINRGTKVVKKNCIRLM